MKHTIKLRFYRLVRGLSRRDVAQLMGLEDPDLIALWEKGCCLPDLGNAFKLVALYNTTIEKLFADITREVEKSLRS